MAALFDFEGYLSALDPPHSYTTILLTGGLTNFTVRAVKTTYPHVHAGRFGAHQSIILKYAPSYIATRGADAPFSQFRQASTIEARALALFASPNGELLALCHRWGIKIPELLHYDAEAHVLILADLGELETLTDQLIRMIKPMSNTSNDEQAYRELGTRLGDFLADLHSSNTLKLLIHNHAADFNNPGVKDVIYDNAVVPTRQRLDDFGIPDAAELYGRVEADHLRPNEAWEQNFILGDLWTGSILLARSKICVIDWEFAGLGRGANGDMAVFLAQLHLYLLAAPPNSSAKAAVRALIRSTVSEYRSQVLRSRNSEDERKGLSIDASTTAEQEVEVLSAIRSAFIVHGRKMINNALEREWSCECCTGKEKVKRNCRMVAKMVDRGVWYLRRAARDWNEFAEDGNWREVRKEKERVILGLFLDA